MKGEYMMELEKLLIEEGERYKRVEMAVRSLVPKRFQGLVPAIPTDEEVKEHIAACRQYYDEYGTKFGTYSPWIEAFNDQNHYSQIALREMEEKRGEPNAEKDDEKEE